MPYNEVERSVAARGEQITLMLVGGGVRSASFIGAIRAIEEKKLYVRKVICSSAGSIVGSLYAAGMTADELMQVAMECDPESFKDVNIWGLLRRFGLYSGKKLQQWVDTKLAGKTFSDKMTRSLQVIATDMLSYRPIIFSVETFPEVKISEAVRASAGMPGVFGYHRLTSRNKNYALVDGALMSGVIERNLGREERTLILKVASKRTLIRPSNDSVSPVKYVKELLTFFLHSQEKEFLKGGKWRDTILLFCADIQPTQMSLNEQEKKYLIEQGYEQTLKYLEYKWGI